MRPFWKLSEGWGIGFAHKGLALRARVILITIFAVVIFANIASYSLPPQSRIVVGTIGLVLVIVAAKRAIDPLHAMIESQKRFIANASHELRTPLAVMKTTSEIAMLHPDKMTRESLLEIITSNMEEIDRMTERIKNLLRLANFDSQMEGIPFTKIDLAGIVGRNADKYERFAKSKGISLTTSIEQSSYIRGNGAAMEDLISNLLDNALKYTKRGGSIHISVDRSNTSVILRATDTGIGIPAQDLNHIFEPFYRGSNATENPGTRSGSGLGLTLVKEIAKKHHGHIKVYSAPETGTTISVIFPQAE